MNEQQEAKTKRQKPTYINTIISISLVLFLLGFLTAFLFQTNLLSRYVKESLVLQLELKKEVSQSEIFTLQDELKQKEYVKKTEYVSKEDALEEMSSQIGDEAISLLDENPLYDAINVNLKAEFTGESELNTVVTELQAMQQVKAVNFQRDLLQNVDTNVRKVSYALVAMAVVFLLISLFIIDNTIRLAVFSERFLIKSMQLVGATRGFIMKPFLKRSLIHGIIAATVSSLAIIGSFYAFDRTFAGLQLLNNTRLIALTLSVVFSMGICIALASTWFSVSRYLRKKVDELY